MGRAWNRRSTALAISLLVLGVVAVALGPKLRVGAQEGSTAGSGFVGAWRVTPRIGGEAAVALTSFTADGLVFTSNRPVQPATPGLPAAVLVQSAAHGSWAATGERTADIAFVILQTDTSGTFLGTRTIRGSLELGEDGDTWSGTFAVTVADPNGAVVQETVGTVEATRIGVEPMPPGATGTPAASPAAAGPGALDAVEIVGDVEQPLRFTVDELRAISSIPPQEVTVTWKTEAGTTESRSFWGTPLHALLERAAPRLGEGGADRARASVVVTGWDGYRAVLSWGELDPALGNDPVLLAYEEDGQPLPEAHRPFYLVVAGDAREDRSVWGVVKIEVQILGV